MEASDAILLIENAEPPTTNELVLINNRPPIVTSDPTFNRLFNETSPLANRLPLSEVSLPTDNSLFNETSLYTVRRLLIEASDAMLLIENAEPPTINESLLINNRPPRVTSDPTRKRLFSETSPPTNNRWFNETSPFTSNRLLSERSSETINV